MEQHVTAAQSNEEKAIVIGAGIAGLLTARVLSDFYGEVLIIERDESSLEPTNRPGTPQAFHPHRMLPRGSMILEHYFPDYIEDLLNLGAYPTMNEKMLVVNEFASFEASSPVKNAACSRALLEYVLRLRVEQIPKVRFLSNFEVTGLQASPDQTRITGVYIQDCSDQKLDGASAADLVVDTTGRSSKVIQWLESLNYVVPEPERLKVSLGYSTRYYKIPQQLDENWTSIISEAQPSKGISTAMLLRFEDNIAGTLLFSAGGEHYPSIDPEQYQTEINLLPDSRMAEIVKELEPVQSPRGYRTPESVRQHFEKMENWPSGLLVLGDAFCCFDPIHGQGMTVAAIEAETLGVCLEEERSNAEPHFERRVMKRMQEAIEPAWWLSSVADLRWKGVEHVYSEPMKGVSFAQKYLDLYMKQTMKLATTENNLSMYSEQFMMNALIISPYEIFNSNVLTLILEDSESIDVQQLLAELGETDPQKFQTRIDELIPSFAHTFD